MHLPRILLAVPLVVAGAVFPALGAAPDNAPATAVGMEHNTFARKSVTVAVGHSLTLVNDSRFVHILGDGEDGRATTHAGDPVRRLQLMQTNATLVTARWNTPGTYHLTCTVHPQMTLQVIVTDGR